MTENQRTILRRALDAGIGYLTAVREGETRSANSLIKKGLCRRGNPRRKKNQDREWVVITKAGVKAALRRTRAEAAAQGDATHFAFISQDDKFELAALCGSSVYHGLTRAPRDGAIVDCADCKDAWVTWCERRPKTIERKIGGKVVLTRATLTERAWLTLEREMIVAAKAAGGGT